MELPFNFYIFLRDTSLVIFSWFLLSTSFFSWGKLLRKILNIEITGKKGVIATVWLGFVFCIIFFSIYHLFLPINVLASSVFYIPSIIYFFVKYGKKLPAFFSSIGCFKIIVIILALYVASAVAIQFPSNLDTGLYHLNSIRWLNEYHIIKGLGNLHAKLGFNQLFFIYSSSLNFHPLFNDYAFHISNSFLYFILFVGSIFSGTVIDLLIICLFFFIPMPFKWISCPTPDIASTIVQLVTFRYLVEIIFFNPDSKERSSYIGLVAILSALLITFKLSNIIFAFGICLITIFWIKKYHFNITEKKILINASIPIFLLFSIWILRGYIQTGYPLFPSSFGRINFAWTVPVEIARIERECIYAGSRSCERTFNINSPLLKNYAWLDRWIEKYFFDKRVFSDKSFSENICIIILLLLFPFILNNYGIASVSLFVITLILLSIWLKSSIINKTISNKEIVLIGLLITGFSSLIFCFSTAPCPRFVNGIFIINFITSLLLLKTVYVQLKVNTKIKNSLLFYFLFVFVLYFCCAYYDNEFAINGMFVLKKAEMKEYTSEYGLKVLTPVNGTIEIWDSALPATPNKISLLSLLGNNISEGFCIKGNIKITVER